MKFLSAVNNMLTRHASLIIIIFAVMAYVQPMWFQWALAYTAPLLGLAMFGMGLTIQARDFGVVLTNPKDIGIGVVAQYTIMPISAWLICYFLRVPTDIAIGLILVGCCPGGTASNVITYIAKGDVSLSVGMTTISTLLAPFITPVLIYLLVGAWVDVALIPMMISVVKVVLLPIILGIGVQLIGSKQVDKIRPVSPILSMIAIVLLIAAIVAANGSKLAMSGILVMGIVILHNTIGLVLGLIIGKWFNLSYSKTTALAIEVGMQNSGLAVTLAATNFAMNPLATLGGAVFSVWHNVSGSIFANWRRKRIHEKEKREYINLQKEAYE